MLLLVIHKVHLIRVRIWPTCSKHFCADGGANVLYDTIPETERHLFIPDLIKGDLDSARKDVTEFYKRNGVDVVHDVCQDTNDLDKCLQAAATEPDPGTLTVVILGAFHGRFDQIMASIHALFKWQGVFHEMIMLADDSLGCLLRPGTTHLGIIHGIEGPGCALVPIAERVEQVSTYGLVWNLRDQHLAFGSLISTSNQIAKSVGEKDVVVTTSHSLLWTCDLHLG